VGDVEFDRLGAVIIVKGKTGMRGIRLIESVQDLRAGWPCTSREKTRCPPLPSKKGRGLKDAARKAGINKRVHPHLLRHTGATHLARVLTEDQMRVYFGWTPTSEVPARYVHLSGRMMYWLGSTGWGTAGAEGSAPAAASGTPREGSTAPGARRSSRRPRPSGWRRPG